MKYRLLLVAACLLNGSLIAQVNCPDPVKYYATNSMNDGIDNARLDFPLKFIVKQDSIIVSVDTAGKNVFMAFKIIDKKCSWNTDFSEGKTSYKLLLGAEGTQPRKYPSLFIVNDKKLGNYIELLYENSKRRVFYLQ